MEFTRPVSAGFVLVTPTKRLKALLSNVFYLSAIAVLRYFY